MKSTVKMLLVTAGISLCFSGLASSAEKAVILGFHKKPGLAEKAMIQQARGTIRRTFRHIRALAVTVTDDELAALQMNPEVAYIEEDAVFTAVEPLAGDEYMNSWGVQHISSDVAHMSGNKGAGVKVAILDTGLDYTHPDINVNYKGGYDYVFRDADPFDDSSYSHGTHVTGIIAGRENGFGVIGVAPEAEVYAVKVLDGGGAGLLSWIIAGIDWAVDNGMDIINMSLEGRDFQSLHDACDAASDAGVLIIAAAGNWGTAVSYPAAYESVVAVTGTDALDMQAFPPDATEVELAAPGLDILSACSPVQRGCSDGYRSLSGTSQAAAHAAGTAALYFSSVDDISSDGFINNADVRLALQMNATDLGPEGRDSIYGFGLVNAAAASFSQDIFLTLTRTHGHPKENAETVSLSGGIYEITLENNGLSGLRVDFFEEGVYQKKLSMKYHFKDKPRVKNKKPFEQSKPQDLTFYIEAEGKDYDVTFTPIGKPGNSINIFISM